MSRIIVILLVVFGFSIQLFGQAERKALQSIERGKWGKAYYHLTRGRYYDSLKVVPPFAWMAYYSAAANPEFNLDSANTYARQTFRSFENTDAKEREKLRRIGIDSATVANYILRIDSSAFVRARKINTTDSYDLFLKDYPEAIQQPLAVKLRDESAYRSALRRNTYQAFHEFIVKYPNASEFGEASRNYERLLFESVTADQSLKSFEKFINEYPGTAFQGQAEKKIFEILTTAGTAECFLKFASGHASNRYSRRAVNILFHLFPEDSRLESFPPSLWNDSLKRAATIHDYLVPYLTNGKFGFMNSNGTSVFETRDNEIKEEYLCGNIFEDVLLLQDKIVAHNGAVIMSVSVNAIDVLAYGLLLARNDSCHFLIHRSGFTIGGSCIRDAVALDANLIAVKNDDGWGVYAINGRLLIRHEWDDVQVINDVLALRTNSKNTLITVGSLSEVLPSRKVTKLTFDGTVDRLPNGHIWIRTNEMQVILNKELDTLYQATEAQMQPFFDGVTVSTPAGKQIVNSSGDVSEVFEEVVIVRRPEIAVKSNGNWSTFDIRMFRKSAEAYDTIVFEGPYTLGFRGDSVVVTFPNRVKVRLKGPLHYSLLTSADTITHLLLTRSTTSTIYTSTGTKLFSGTYQRLKYLTNRTFMFYRNEKVGLVSSTGKIVLPASMDAIAPSSGPLVSLLKDGKFGLFNCAMEKQIKPQYSKNLTAYGMKYLVAFKDEKYGFIGWDNKVAGKFEFDDIQYWNDSSALVKKNHEWMIYDITSGKVLQDKIRKFRLFDSERERVAIVQLEHSFGVIGNKTGEILPFEYSDIVNVGSPQNPFYFTEKHVEEASLFVVRYFDTSGRMVRKEVYNQDQYEEVYCPNN